MRCVNDKGIENTLIGQNSLILYHTNLLFSSENINNYNIICRYDGDNKHSPPSFSPLRVFFVKLNQKFKKYSDLLTQKCKTRIDYAKKM